MQITILQMICPFCSTLQKKASWVHNDNASILELIFPKNCGIIKIDKNNILTDFEEKAKRNSQ